MKEKNLYILTYDHGGYVLWKDRVKPRLKDILVWMEKYPKLRIGLDYESFTFDIFEEEDPEINELVKELLEKYKSMLSAPVLEDLREEYAFWHSYRGWLDKISSLFYNQYLIHNNQPEGLERYNMMAKLIVAWEKQQ